MGAITGRIVGVSGPTALPVPTVGQIVENVTALRALVGSAALPAVALAQHSSSIPNVGGGVYRWDTTAADDDSGNRLNAGGHGTSGVGWQRVERTGDVTCFGADPSGVADSTVAIQRAIDATGAGRVFVPNGLYKITSTLTISTHGAQLVGESATYRGAALYAGAVLKWSGAASTMLSCISTYGVTLQDLVIVGPGTGIGLRMGGALGASQSGCTLRRLYLVNHTTCFDWGDDDNYYQSDSFTIDQLQCWNFVDYGVHIRSVNAADGTTISNSFMYSTSATGVCLYGEFHGFFTMQDTDGGGACAAFVKLSAPGGNNVLLRNCEAEGTDRFLHSVGANDGRTITLDNCTITGSAGEQEVEIEAADRVVVLGGKLGTPWTLGPGARVQNFGGRTLGGPLGTQGLFSVDVSGGGTWLSEKAAGGAAYGTATTNAEYEAKGTVLRDPSSFYTANAAAGELTTRSGYRVQRWAANTVYATNDMVQSKATDSAHVFKCTTPGTSDPAVEPTWDTGTGATTADGTVVWTECGASSLHRPYGAPGVMRLSGVPSGFYERGTIILKEGDITSGDAVGWVKLTSDSDSNTWRSFGHALGSTDGTPAYVHALRGSALDSKPLHYNQTTVTLDEAGSPPALLTLSAAEYAYPLIGFGGTLTENATVTFPTQQGAIWVVSNYTTGGFSVLLKTSGGATWELVNASQALVWCNGTNVLPLAQFNGDFGPVIVGTGDPEGAVSADIGNLFLRKDGVRGAVLYVKEAGVSDTGWRNVDGPGMLAPGSRSFASGQWHIQYKRLQLTGTQRLTLAGDARYILTDI